MKNKLCPNCERPAARVLFMGAPMWLCLDHQCGTLWGFWSWVIMLFPIPSEDDYGDDVWKFYAYEDSYLAALWRWLKGAE